MKIKYLFIFLTLFTSFLWADEDCEQLKKSEESLVSMSEEWRFNNIYPYELCLLNSPIHKDAVEYLQGIKKITDKSVRELVTDAGNVFCRWYYGQCGENSIYHRFIKSCNDARNKTVEQLRKTGSTEPINAHFINYSFGNNNCPALAENYIVAYKEVAIEEIAINHFDRIEESSESYLKPSYEKMKALSIVWNSFVKIFGNIARSLEGLTPLVHL
jgi:hypothetical protein